MRCVDKEAVMKDCVVTFLYSDLTTDELYILLEYNKYIKSKTNNRYKCGELQRRIETIIDIIDFRDDLLE